MKQTNNAIKFLMAQYRAIFKNANLKMFLAAATAAAAMAAGQAQAATPEISDWTALSGTMSLNGDSQKDGTTLKVVAADKKVENANGFNLTVTSGSHTISGASGHNALTTKAGTITSITLSGDGTAVAQPTLAIGGAADAHVDVTITNFNNYAGTLTITGAEGNTSSLVANNIQIGGTAAPSTRAKGSAAVVELKGHSTLGSETTTEQFKILAGGELKFSGAANYAKSTGGIIVDGGKISVAESGAGNIESALTVSNGGAVSVAGGNNSGSLTINGKLTVNDKGVVEVTTGAKGGELTLHNADFNTGSELKVGSGASVTLNGTTTFAAGTIKDKSIDAKGKVSVGNVTAKETRVINIGTAELANLMKGTFEGTGAADTSKLHIKLSDSGDAALDLEKAGIVSGDGSPKIALKTSGTATIFGKNAKYLKEKFNGTTAYDFNNLEVGTGADGKAFTLQSKAGIVVHDTLSAESGASLKTLTISGGSLTLDATGKGSVKAETIVLNDPADKSGSVVDVKGGEWDVNALTLTKGEVKLNNATLNVAGKLAIADNNGLVEANASVLNLTGEKSDLSTKTANTVKLSNTSVLNAKASDFFKFENNTVTVEATDFAKGAVSGDATSTLNLTGFTGELNDEQLKTLISGIGFGGIVSGVNVKTSKQDGVDIGEISSGSDAYKDTVVSVSAPVTGAYSVEGVKLKEGTTELAIGSSTDAGSLTLNNPESGKFVTNAKGEIANVKLDNAGSGLVLAGSGEIGAIDTPTAGQGSVTIGLLDKGGNVTVGEIGKTGAVGHLTVNENVSLTAKGDIKAQDFIFNGKELQAEGKTLTVGGADVGSVARVVEIMGDVDAKALDIVADQKKVTIAGGAHLTLDTLKANSGTTNIYVGQDGQDGKEAVLDVGALVLGGATLAVDPEYGKPAALVFAKGFNDAGVKNDKDAGVLGGKIIIGQNSAVAVGFDSEADARLVLSEYLINKGGFADPNAANPAPGLVANALVLNKHLDVGQNDGILVDSSAKNVSASTPAVTGNKVELKDNTALVVTDNVYTVGAGGKKEGSAITFTHTAKGTVNLSDKTTIVLAGDFDAADDGIQLFSGSSAANAPTVTISGAGKAKVVSSNELLVGEIDSATGKITNLKFMDNGVVFRDASAPVTEIMLNKVKGKYKANAGKGFAGYDYMTALSKGTSAAGLDKLTHAATFAGAQQAAVASVTTMAEAVGGRVGALGVEAASIAATGSQANGGVWITPMYKSVDADGFAAQGTTYGSDIDLAGVTFGADTVNGNMRFGAAFNIGSGKADGKGQGEGLKDDFDYYGFGIYSAMGFGNFALVGDASLNVISHDVEGYSGVEEFGMAKGKADTTAVTMGITGQYTISSPAVDVTPHLGARFIRLDTDSYDVNTNKGVVASTDFDVQNVFSIPLGVTLSKVFEMGGWSLAPSADLTITFNTGDTDAKSNTYITGVENVAFTTEVLDEVTYGVALGLGAQYGAFGTQIGINYTGSSNTDSFGVNAQARYMF